MGNYNSCVKSQSSKMSKLVDSQGQVRLVDLPTTVAEIMLENPGFAIAPVDQLMQTRRIAVMKADDMLLGRKVYLLVPVEKVNSRMSGLQLAAIDSLVCAREGKGVGRTRGSSKVSPVVETGLTGLSSGGAVIEDLVKDLNEKCTGLAGQKKKRLCKAWAPVLEPILE